MSDDIRALVVVVTLFSAGCLAGVVVSNELDEEVPPRVEVSTEALLDAATIEIRGYGPDGELGEWLHDCVYEGDRLVCTQREAKP